jgi:hypothetical protein
MYGITQNNIVQPGMKRHQEEWEKQKRMETSFLHHLLCNNNDDRRSTYKLYLRQSKEESKGPILVHTC